MKIIYVFLLSFILVNTYSQDSVFSVNRKFKQGVTPKSFGSYSANEASDGNLHLTLFDNKSIDRYIINSNWKVIDLFSSVRGVYSELPFDRVKNMNLITTPNKEYNISNIVRKHYDIYEIDYQHKKESKISDFDIGKNETAIACFTDHNIFYLITASNKDNTLFIISNTLRGGILFDTVQVKLDIKDNTGSGKSAASYMSDVSVVVPWDRNTDKLACANKIYFRGNVIYISNDDENATSITEVNLKNGMVHQHNFNQDYAEGRHERNRNNKEVNSFLYHNILVNGNVYHSSITVSFYNYETGNLLKRYRLENKADSINFKNSPILSGDNKEVKIKRFISDALALNGGLILALSDKGNDQIELLMESFKDIHMMGGGAGIMGNSTFSTPRGSIYVPSATGIDFGSDYFIHRSSYFTGLFNPVSLEHQDKDNEVISFAETMEKALDDSKKGAFFAKQKKEAITIFKRNNYLYMGYYDPKTEDYIIRKLGEDKE